MKTCKHKKDKLNLHNLAKTGKIKFKKTRPTEQILLIIRVNV